MPSKRVIVLIKSLLSIFSIASLVHILLTVSLSVLAVQYLPMAPVRSRAEQICRIGVAVFFFRYVVDLLVSGVNKVFVRKGAAKQ